MPNFVEVWMRATALAGAIAVGFDANRARYDPVEVVGWGERFWMVCVGNRGGPTLCASDKDARGRERIWLDARGADRVVVFACGAVNPYVWSPGPFRLSLRMADGTEKTLDVQPARYATPRAWFAEARTCNWVTWRSADEIASALRDEVQRVLPKARIGR